MHRNPNLDNLKDDLLSLSLSERSGWTANLGLSQIDLNVPRGDGWWTGKPPLPGICPGIGADSCLHSLPGPPNLATFSRSEVLAYFNNGWTLTEVLFAGLVGDEPFYRPPYHGLRHPLIFYYVHPACLYINKLRVAGLLAEPVDSFIETLFETGVDEMSWDDMSKNEIAWPSLDQAQAYRRQVYSLVENIIVNHPGLADGHAPVTDKDPLWALFMAFEHERIHLETSSVLIRELPSHLVCRPSAFPAPADTAAPARQEGQPLFLPVAGGPVQIGKDRDFPTFGWDNEYGLRQAVVEDFEVSATLITNGQFLEFVRAGGYSQASYWSAEGLRWKQYRNAKWPTFWVPEGPQGLHHYRLRTIFDIIDMPVDWPCIVNYHEARAYACWLSSLNSSAGYGASAYRLLTEAEHYRLRIGRRSLNGANLGLVCGSEGNVGGDDSQPGDLFGNVWQWLEDDFYPLPQARVHPYYDDFSTPCYDGEHKMIVGGSFISTGDEATVHARFHFRPHFFQHAGIRLVRSKNTNNGQVVLIKKDALGRALPVNFQAQEGAGISDLERQKAVNLKVLADFSYLLDDQIPAVRQGAVPNPGLVLGETVRRLSPEADQALDVGSSLGALSYALAETVASVVAVELREPLFERALQIQRQGVVQLTLPLGGKLCEERQYQLDSALLSRVSFKRADPVSLPAEFQNFAVVLLNDIITAVPSPASLLGRLSGERGLVAVGGLLLVLSDFAWGDACEESLWLGGRLDQDGRPIDSASHLVAELAPSFDLVERRTLPYFELLGAGKTIWGEKQLLALRRR